LAAAAYHGNSEIVDTLLARGGDPGAPDAMGKTPILYAAARGFADIVDRFLALGVDINAVYGNQLTLLMWAAGHADDVPEQDGLDLVASLISRGARVEPADDRGRTALMIAAEQGRAAIVDALLKAGANPGGRDREGKTALDLASNEATRLKLSGG
jgi:ankyrin repeat protein